MARVLVVDDEADVREVIRDALMRSRYEVVTVPDVNQAVSICADEPIDLIVLDLSFPEGSGVSFLKEIRRVKNTVPIVIYSGMVTSETEKNLRLAGATEVLSKQFGVKTLVGQIEKIVKSGKRLFQDASERPPGTLLIVDDEASVRHLLREFFQTKHYRTLEAENGKQAIELVRSENPSVVLLDVVMPVMDGLTALHKLLEINPKLGVVMVTGQRDDQTVKKAMEAGAYSYVLKPFDLLYLELVVLSKLMIAEATD